jgi:ABC-type bacteriocin/lantibiotic exporter with double-glycine peptidase domain
LTGKPLDLRPSASHFFDQLLILQVQEQNKTAGVTSRRFLNRIRSALSSTLLTATTTTFLAATALFLAFPLLPFSFLSLAISLLLAALLPGAARFAWFVWILLSFHITFRCYIFNPSYWSLRVRD